MGNAYSGEFGDERKSDQGCDLDEISDVLGIRSVLSGRCSVRTGLSISHMGYQIHEFRRTIRTKLVKAIEVMGKIQYGSAIVRSVTQEKPPSFSCGSGVLAKFLSP